MTVKASISIHIGFEEGTTLKEADQIMKTALTALSVESLHKIVEAKVSQTVAEIDMDSSLFDDKGDD